MIYYFNLFFSVAIISLGTAGIKAQIVRKYLPAMNQYIRKYLTELELPIHFIVEDNKMSVCTNTREVWNQKKLTYENISDEYVTYYSYENKYPHAGAGKRVQFYNQIF